MVTGIEVVGLVLAVLPILANALDEYQIGIEKIKRTIHYDSQLKKLTLAVKGQVVFFTDHLQILLDAAAPDAYQIQYLPDDYSKELWSGPIGEQIERYLGARKYDYFQGLVSAFETCLRELARELDYVQKSPEELERLFKDRPTLPDLKTLIAKSPEKKRFFTRGVQFLMRDNKIKQLNKELEKLTDRMHMLLENSDTIKRHRNRHQYHSKADTIPEVAKASSLAEILHRVRGRADGLFKAFFDGWVPGCHASHNAMLFLDTPVSSKISCHSARADETTFEFRLVLQCAPCNNEITSWHEIIVTVSQDGGHLDMVNTINSGAELGRAGNFRATPKPLVSSTTATTQQPALERIYDLCEESARARSAQRSLGLRLSQDEYLVRKDPGAWSKCTAPSSGGTITLETLLSEKHRILPQHKISIALKLAASLLQFKTSQWLRDAWTDQAIHFFRESPQVVALEWPLVPHTFANPKPPDWDNTLEKKPKSMFLELGILMLELWNQKTLTEWAEESQRETNVTAIMRPGLANSWYAATDHMMSLGYSKAVDACLCLKHEFDRAIPSWDNKHFRLSVCAKIIEPLLEECRHLRGGG